MKRLFIISSNSRNITALIITLFINYNTTWAQKKELDTSTLIIQISDPQFGMFEKNKGFQKETILYEKAVDMVNSLNPNFVVITGDFVNDKDSESQINEFKRITAKINPEIPIYFTPGNHDIGKIPTKKDIKKYRKNYGNDKFAFIYNNHLFIGLNSGLIKAQVPKAEQKQYNWLIRQLKKNRKVNQTVLFCHYPFYINAENEPENYSNIDPKSRKVYLQLFDKYDVDAVFSGHTHDNVLNNYEGIEMVSTSAIGKPLGKAKSGMRIIKISDDKISHEYIEIE